VGFNCLQGEKQISWVSIARQEESAVVVQSNRINNFLRLQLNHKPAYWKNQVLAFYFDGNTEKLPDCTFHCGGSEAFSVVEEVNTDAQQQQQQKNKVFLDAKQIQIPASVDSQIVPNKTVIMCHKYSGGFLYCINDHVPTTWKEYSFTVKGHSWNEDRNDDGSFCFRKGTTHANLIMLCNYQNPNATVLIQNLTMEVIDDCANQ